MNSKRQRVLRACLRKRGLDSPHHPRIAVIPATTVNGATRFVIVRIIVANLRLPAIQESKLKADIPIRVIGDEFFVLVQLPSNLAGDFGGKEIPEFAREVILRRKLDRIRLSA